MEKYTRPEGVKKNLDYILETREFSNTINCFLSVCFTNKCLKEIEIDSSF